MFVEKLITRAKNAVSGETDKKNIHARREVARYIKDREVVKELFGEIAPKVANRAGGYTRVVKLGQRHGDGAEVAILELVDYQLTEEQKKASAKAEKTKKKKEKQEGAKADRKSKLRGTPGEEAKY